MTDKLDNAQQDLADNKISGDAGNHFPTHEPAYDQAQPGLSEHAGGSRASEGVSYVPGHDGGREALADSVEPHSDAQSGGLGQTNFAAGGAQGQGSSGLGSPPEDYMTPKEHAAQQRQHGDSAGQEGQQSTGGQLPSRSPLEEKPQADSTMGFGAKSDGQTPGLHSGAVPNDPASSSSHGGGQDPSFEGRSQQELTQSGRQGGPNSTSDPSSDTKGASTAVGAGAAGAAAGAATGGSSAAAAAHTPQSDSELVSKYSTKQEAPKLSTHDLDADQAATGTASQQQGSAAAGSPAASPSSARATQSSDKEPLPTSKNAEGVLDADKGAAGKASGSNKKAGKACCSVM